ncbi:MAG: oligosaccharide flippase family protein [bacterium]|nr:oligosaccharide flippase family protein [bacterium]
MEPETEAEIIEDINIEQIKKRSVRGVLSLVGRRIVLRVLGQISFIFLARILSPGDIGIFTIVSFVVNFFGFFSDIGLAAALIQKKGELTKEDLRTTFTVQQLLVGSLVLLTILLAPYLVHTFYANSLNESHIILIQVLAFSLLLASFKSVPSVILERKLEFNKLIWPEIIETLVYNILLVTMAYSGYGVWSFIVAVLARGIIGTAVIYAIAPWPIGFKINTRAFKQLYGFGIPYQLNSLIALIKDNIIPTFVAATLGTNAVGIIGVGQKYAFLPLEIMGDIIRVTFPTYARLQEHPELLKKALEKSLYFLALAAYPALFGLIALIPWIAEYILSPRSNPTKWVPILPLFYLFTFSTFWAILSTTFTNALFAIGKAKIVLNFMILWTILTWTLTPLATWKYGVNGVGIASAIISFTSIGVIVIMKRYVKVEIIKNIGPQLLMAVAMGILLRFLAISYLTNIFMLFVFVALGGVIYICGMYIISGKRLVSEVKYIISAYKKK